MIPIRIRHKVSHRGLGYTAFSLKDSMSKEAVASWIIATLQCQGISLPDAEIRIGTGPWKAGARTERKANG